MVFLKEKNTLTIITNGCKGVFAKITACRQCAWGPQVTYSHHYFFYFYKLQLLFLFQNLASLNLVLKTYVTMLNDYVYESVSNIASLKIIDNS
jgi:hypothetical protein